MKKALESLFKNIGYILSFIFPFTIYINVRRFRSAIFSGYIKRQFKSVGANFNVDSPLLVYGSKYIAIGDNFIAGARLRIEAYDKFMNTNYTPQIVIGNNVNINFDCHIGCIDSIKIGNNVLIASKVLIIDHAHGSSTLNDIKYPPLQRELVSKGPIVIGDNVWIGEGCAILPGVKIGENCIIGSNAVVTKSFGANSIIGGNPAKLIKYIE
ncbi:Acetyltransferase (isoleucine patch superfamily) [Mucilaginibacter mallensis]|uniref:Acetyltransferase (Isoleucine patch superfamily) n=1 Tax=Mucilaginibacter mallensis TaxID=652787 RepID=A0A1H1YMC3_MUCMA|nr:DapH/DapD/GlmU-related protein [Mucilaginibacter mallensis]SDT22603.1 Acetyltransferase (isoleucine patch superfamily) [Mucilaginibacter mallensis]